MPATACCAALLRAADDWHGGRARRLLRLRSITLPPGAVACGMSLKDRPGPAGRGRAQHRQARRGPESLRPDLVVKSGDTLVLRGRPGTPSLAEERLCSKAEPAVCPISRGLRVPTTATPERPAADPRHDPHRARWPQRRRPVPRHHALLEPSHVPGADRPVRAPLASTNVPTASPGWMRGASSSVGAGLTSWAWASCPSARRASCLLTARSRKLRAGIRLGHRRDPHRCREGGRQGRAGRRPHRHRRHHDGGHAAASAAGRPRHRRRRHRRPARARQPAARDAGTPLFTLVSFDGH